MIIISIIGPIWVCVCVYMGAHSQYHNQNSYIMDIIIFTILCQYHVQKQNDNNDNERKIVFDQMIIIMIILFIWA